MYYNEHTEKKKWIYSYNEVETRLEDSISALAPLFYLWENCVDL